MKSKMFLFILVMSVIVSGCDTREKARKDLERKGVEYSQLNFLEASKNGNKEDVELFIKAGIDVNAKGEYGRTALMWASRNGHTEIARLLIEKGADVNAKDEYGRTALGNASIMGHTEIVNLLRAAGAKK